MREAGKSLGMAALHDLHGSLIEPGAQKLQRAVPQPVGQKHFSNSRPTTALSRACSQDQLALRGSVKPSAQNCGEDFLRVSSFLLCRTGSSPVTNDECQVAALRATQAWHSCLVSETRQLKKGKAPAQTKEASASPLTCLERLIEDTEPLPSQGERWQTCKRAKRWRRRARCTKLKLLKARIPAAEELAHPFASELLAERLAREEKSHKSRYPSSFEAFRRAFLERHGHTIKANLGAKSAGSVEMKAAPVSREVQDRFIAECAAAPGGEVVPTYHGSRAENYDSICKRGLLIPGRGNELAVVNGAAHGKGIYTATVDAPSLSMSFCSEPKLLVCGVLDDSVELMPEQESCGRFAVGARSQSIKHVGDAIVVFNERRVIPLFEAAAGQFLPYQSKGWQRQGGQSLITANTWLGAAAPRHHNASACLRCSSQTVVPLSKGKAYHVASRQFAFMPPREERCWIPQKRVYEAKVRDQCRRQCRREKAAMMLP
mmetsp:Transcript_91208/g.175602  ORF Transcript_91208/g.175602 Transcript_91208/m.175602 type:complete len:488 (-) Transcript_91208:176-1639(-)